VIAQSCTPTRHRRELSRWKASHFRWHSSQTALLLPCTECILSSLALDEGLPRSEMSQRVNLYSLLAPAPGFNAQRGPLEIVIPLFHRKSPGIHYLPPLLVLPRFDRCLVPFFRMVSQNRVQSNRNFQTAFLFRRAPRRPLSPQYLPQSSPPCQRLDIPRFFFPSSERISGLPSGVFLCRGSPRSEQTLPPPPNPPVPPPLFSCRFCRIRGHPSYGTSFSPRDRR